jgi:type VI secretion system secreted protein Hcp
VKELNMAIYMKFADIKGQVTTDGFKDWIELSGVNYDVSRNTLSGAGGASREGAHPQFSDIHITKHFDVASPLLYRDSVAGAFDSKVEIKLTATTKNKIDTYLAFELTDCGVSSYHTGGDGQGTPQESMSLNFTKITVTPSPLDSSGQPKKGAVVTYDLLKMKAS